MNTPLRQAQLKALAVFAKKPGHFALAGGTALELYYLKHRFSADLDFFSPVFRRAEINSILAELKAAFGKKPTLENEFSAPDRAKVIFYTIPVKGSRRPLKLDFVEEVLSLRPEIKRFNGIPVYAPKAIYFHKISALTGTMPYLDDTGSEVSEGRMAARDVFDVYMLSRKIMPLHIFLKPLSSQWQRGIIHWYRSFSRHELKIALLDLDIYDKKFNATQMILYLEDEIKKFIKEVM